MTTNPVLRRLGLSLDERAVIIYADDLGMCQATLAGLEELLEAGIVSSGSIMWCPTRGSGPWRASPPSIPVRTWAFTSR
jgi:hypothetical protein